MGGIVRLSSTVSMKACCVLLLVVQQCLAMPPEAPTPEQLELRGKERTMQAQLEMQKVQKDLVSMDKFMEDVRDVEEQNTLKGDVSRALEVFRQQGEACEAEKKNLHGQVGRYQAEVITLQKRIRELEQALLAANKDKDILEKANKNMLGTFSNMFKSVQQAESTIQHTAPQNPAPQNPTTQVVEGYQF